MKLRLAVIALVMPMSLSAQQPPAPSPQQVANPVTFALRGRITAMHRNIAQAFDSIPASKFDYKPTPAQLTIGYIAQHVADDSYYFCENMGDLKGTRDAKDISTPDTVRAKWPKDELVTKLKASFAFCAKALDQLDDKKIGEQFTMTMGGNSRPSFRINMALGHALDLADHYSQLANYMRLNGMLPPTALPRPGRGGGGN